LRSWDDLRFFLAVARAPSLTAAAKALRVNKSTASRRLAALEKEIGARLVEVRGHRTSLTGEGQRLLEHALGLERRIQEIERDLTARDARLEGKVTLATTDALAREVLVPLLASFIEALPGVRIDVVTGNRALDLQQGLADVALRHGPRPADGDLVARRICSLAGALYASRAYLRGRGRPERHADLAAHRIVGIHAELADLPAAKLVDALVPQESVALRYGDLGAQVAAVEAGLGIAALPCFVGDQRPLLVRLFPPEEALAQTLWLVWHRDLSRTSRVRALVDHLAQGLTRSRALFEGDR
jgi:DNA-binding transcriptional LysR family regulator